MQKQSRIIADLAQLNFEYSKSLDEHASAVTILREQVASLEAQLDTAASNLQSASRQLDHVAAQYAVLERTDKERCALVEKTIAEAHKLVDSARSKGLSVIDVAAISSLIRCLNGVEDFLAPSLKVDVEGEKADNGNVVHDAAALCASAQPSVTSSAEPAVQQPAESRQRQGK